LNSVYGTASEVNIFNFDVPGYISVLINVFGLINMIDVDVGSATLAIIFGGFLSTANGFFGDFAIFYNIDAGDMTLTRI
jgi:hypothetical protein